jgi:hypothetical protein
VIEPVTGGNAATCWWPGRELDFVQVGDRRIDGRIVPLHNGLAPLAVGLVDRLLDVIDRFVLGQYVGQGEEAGLHDRVDASAHPGFASDGQRIDHVELQLACR